MRRSLNRMSARTQARRPLIWQIVLFFWLRFCLRGLLAILHRHHVRAGFRRLRRVIFRHRPLSWHLVVIVVTRAWHKIEKPRGALGVSPRITCLQFELPCLSRTRATRRVSAQAVEAAMRGRVRQTEVFLSTFLRKGTGSETSDAQRRCAVDDYTLISGQVRWSGSFFIASVGMPISRRYAVRFRFICAALFPDSAREAAAFVRQRPEAQQPPHDRKPQPKPQPKQQQAQQAQTPKHRQQPVAQQPQQLRQRHGPRRGKGWGVCMCFQGELRSCLL